MTRQGPRSKGSTTCGPRAKEKGKVGDWRGLVPQTEILQKVLLEITTPAEAMKDKETGMRAVEIEEKLKVGERGQLSPRSRSTFSRGKQKTSIRHSAKGEKKIEGKRRRRSIFYTRNGKKGGDRPRARKDTNATHRRLGGVWKRKGKEKGGGNSVLPTA